MLTNRVNRSAGFTLIELVVTIAIFALLVALTVPTMRTWVANVKVRAVADSLQNGIRVAQSESLRRSRQVVFALTNDTNPAADVGTWTAATSGTYWAVQTVPLTGEAPVVIQTGMLTSAGSTVTIAAQQGQTEICFNSVGRLVANASTFVPGGSCTTPTTTNNNTLGVPMFTYKVSMTGGASMQVEVGLGGQLHLCDPTQTLSSTNPYGC